MDLVPLKPSKIRKGDFVVHSAYGIGRFDGVFEGLMRRGERIVKQKYLKVAFRDRVLEVPTYLRQLIKLFKRREEVDEYEPVKLDTTRSRRSWVKRKARALKDVLGVASDLVAMYAERQSLTRPPCAPDGPLIADFEAGFPFSPTADQLSCFADVQRDMVSSERPMDRLVCGDVGFGKTEAAMRAAYRAVSNGRQVAFLSPTTVLAAQHLLVLRRRMPQTVRVEMLSTLVKRSAKERQALLDEVADGAVHILVGTHALLSPKIRWGKLGLLVVDEEQRFGVRQKDQMKQAALGIDVLSLSATPIPRTMYMCMSGIRDMSSLETPPDGRRPVETRVMTRHDESVCDAIRAEMARGGQVFYVVPRIEHVQREMDFLTSLVPEARLSYAYGGLRDLERRIVDFTLGESDVLVATTIMENGIDIPNVNTIVVQDTQLFGLSQLHQLRGRVGRASVQAYALMMHPDPATLRPETLERLRVLQRETGLGAGHALSRADLELRGAGTLFGTAQKGSFGAKEVGTDFYFEVLQRAMRYIEEQRDSGVDAADINTALQGDELLAALGLDGDESSLMDLSDALAAK
mmetsp:Transcript_31408/g.98457  ORF Transcript_31408/g.98457 Transcript_31408/m.98457 type:complete len:576 (-) Transcript_31408:63-1790(-)